MTFMRTLIFYLFLAFATCVSALIAGDAGPGVKSPELNAPSGPCLGGCPKPD